MDPITHALLGASCAQLLLSEKNRYAWLAGGMAAMAPDLDVFIRSASDPLRILLYHRHFTHALLFIPLGAALVTLVLMLFKPFRSHWFTTFLAALTGFATHGLLDACTTYGTLLYWPFSDKRVSWDIIAIIDPYITFPLFLGLVWTAVHRNIRGTVIGLAVAGFFLSLNIFQHQRVYQAILAYAETRAWDITALRTFPKFASTTQWRGLGIVNHQLVLMDISAFLKPAVSNVRFYPLFSTAALPDYVKNSPTLFQDFQIFHWFSDGYLVLVNSNPLIVSDGLFLNDRKPAHSLWSIQFLPDHKHVEMVNPEVN